MKKILATLLVAGLTACNSSQTQTTQRVKESVAQVLEYTPAPGQFINETAGFTGFNGEKTPAEAVAYAQKRLNNKDLISLGAWGGYLVAAFAQPVPAAADYELYVVGNGALYSSEPGVVWVAQDSNGDGSAAGETWYELRGSDSNHADYLRNYAVTYSQPNATGEIAWRDNQGGSGFIYRIEEHTQASYFPAWLGTSERTYTGVRLPNRVYLDGATWRFPAAQWGYADNYSTTDMHYGANNFRIADAVDATGNAANLTAIDFIKVQTGVLFADAACPTGELSTEVMGIGCYRNVVVTE